MKTYRKKSRMSLRDLLRNGVGFACSYIAFMVVLFVLYLAGPRLPF